MYKILSLDGGGSWAIIQLLTLKERFKVEIPSLKGHEILRQFDLIIANSGGSIVLAALAENMTIDEAIHLFDEKENRERIFSENSYQESFWPVTVTRLFSFGPKYSTRRKRIAFGQLFPKCHGMLMNELPDFIGKPSLKLIVCTYDALNNRAKFFRSYPQGNTGGEFVKLTQAIHGSSNAPVQYFDFPARFKANGSNIFYELWDGALGGFNNPTVAGIIEAFRSQVPLEDMRLISIGNGNKLMSMVDKENFYKIKSITIKERFKKLNLFSYKFQFQYFKQTVLNQAKTILYEPPDWSNFVALMFLSKTAKESDSVNFIRLSPLIHIDGKTDPSIVPLLDKLYALDMDLTEDSEISLIKECFEKWKNGAIQNQPIHFEVQRNNDLVYHFGDEWFENAMDKWRNLDQKKNEPRENE